MNADEDILVQFLLPSGVNVSAPWAREADVEGAPVFRIGHSPYDWPSAVAFGHFEERQIEVPGARFAVTILDGNPTPDHRFVYQWLAQAAEAVSALYGRFPVPRLQILVIPIARGEEPVPWAYVQRGGGPAVHLFINQRLSADAFTADWSAIHELSHLFLPYVQSDDAWLSEGLATYYQNVLSARVGKLAPDAAWNRMHEGFELGRESMRGMTLIEATERMYRHGSFLRVYWEGAAIMLMADERLRVRTEGRMSLDEALDRFQRCCLLRDSGLRAREIFEKLDELTDTRVFAELYEEMLPLTLFPDLGEVYRRLGLEEHDGSVSLAQTAPEKMHRDAIMHRAADHDSIIR